MHLVGSAVSGKGYRLGLGSRALSQLICFPPSSVPELLHAHACPLWPLQELKCVRPATSLCGRASGGKTARA
eukprot:1157686-Pelagomonas_calceolata.AAC.7